MSRLPRGAWSWLGVLAVVALVAVTIVVGQRAAVAPAAAPAPVATPTTSAPAPVTTAPVTTPAPPPVTTPGPPVFDPQRLSIDDPASEWVVVNKTRPLQPLDHEPAGLQQVAPGVELAAPAAQAMDQLVAAAAAQGLTVTPLSGYRSYDYQRGVHASAVSRLGEAAADVASARAGYSEHQTGFGVDVGGGGCDIERCFGDTDEGRWVAAEAWRFGYVVRYTAAEQGVTGYKGEPWHLRYVGVELATELRARGVATLEQFFGLPAAPDYLS